MDSPEAIFLEPATAKHSDLGRMWCEDDDPSDEGEPWIKYVRADKYAELEAESARLQGLVLGIAATLEHGSNSVSAVSRQLWANRIRDELKALTKENE